MKATPAETRRLVEEGAKIVDIRDPDEFALESIPGAVNVPLDRIVLDGTRSECPAGPLVFHCRSGIRTGNNAATLITAARGEPCYIMTGGLDGWRAAGFPTEADRSLPIEMNRQVHLVLGVLVLLGVGLALFVSPWFYGLTAFVGAGLITAGVTGWCAMERPLSLMPWNRSAARRSLST